ncbi:MAG TPA: hypothetical protein VND64_08085 [Pirellulales bacterium]|nr:hypothetical protein [Pirellulales bacterium]
MIFKPSIPQTSNNITLAALHRIEAIGQARPTAILDAIPASNQPKSDFLTPTTSTNPANDAKAKLAGATKQRRWPSQRLRYRRDGTCDSQECYSLHSETKVKHFDDPNVILTIRGKHQRGPM